MLNVCVGMNMPLYMCGSHRTTLQESVPSFWYHGPMDKMQVVRSSQLQLETSQQQRFCCFRDCCSADTLDRVLWLIKLVVTTWRTELFMRTQEMQIFPWYCLDLYLNRNTLLNFLPFCFFVWMRQGLCSSGWPQACFVSENNPEVLLLSTPI